MSFSIVDLHIKYMDVFQVAANVKWQVCKHVWVMLSKVYIMSAEA